MVTEKGDFILNKKVADWAILKYGKDGYQRKFAEDLGCDESLVSQWFSKKKPKKPSDNYARIIALMTGLDDVKIFDRTIERSS